MLNQKDNWMSLLLLTYAQQPLNIATWKNLITNFGEGLRFDKFALYTEAVQTTSDEYGAFDITSGNWKGRQGTGQAPKYIQVVKVNFQKDDKKPFTIDEIGELRAYFKNFRLVLPETSKIGFLGMDYYPYKDPFKVDRGLPATPKLPGSWGPIIASVVSVIGALAYAKKA